MLHEKQAKSVLNKFKKRDSWFLVDYSVNPYEGCSCNCLYCYVRGSKYGENMDAGLSVKTNVLELLEKQLALRARKGQFGIVAVGSATDAYLRHEEKYGFTKGILQLLIKYRFPAFISTKSTLILRDLDLLTEIDQNAILPEDLRGTFGRGLILSISVSTTNPDIASMLEPGAATPAERFNILSMLKGHGFFVGVNAIPVLPFISDSDEELEKIMVSANNAGADYLLVGGLTLFGTGPADSKTLFYQFLERYDPGLIPRYNKLYGKNFFPPREYQEALAEKAANLSSKYNLRNSILNKNVHST